MGRHDRIIKTDLLILGSALKMEWVMAKGRREVP
jgi:hypothetical protein